MRRLRFIGSGDAFGSGGRYHTCFLVERERPFLIDFGASEWADSLVTAARGADLFISEAYFFDKKVKWHIDYKTLSARLGEIGAKRVILTHMSAELLARLGEVALETAEDGKSVEI